MFLDKINSMFEFAGAIVTWMNVHSLYKAKKVIGINYASVIVFSLMGVWHLCYYSALDQFLSFYSGILIVSGNVTWLLLLFIFKNMYKNQ